MARVRQKSATRSRGHRLGRLAVFGAEPATAARHAHDHRQIEQAAMGVATNYGALSLYINFINLFQMLLSLFGSRR